MAISAVLLFHFGAVGRSETGVAHVVLAICNASWIGVDLFFVLSGFLITNTLLLARGKQGYFRNFWGRRFLRIFPAYYAVIAVTLFVVPRLVAGVSAAPLDERQGWLWCFVSNLWPMLYGSWGFHNQDIDLNHTWSLAIEEQFYLVWPFVIAWLSPRAALRCALALALASLGLRLFVLEATWPATPLAVYTSTFTRLDGLLLGAAVAIASHLELRPWRTYSRWLPAAFVPVLALWWWRGPSHEDAWIAGPGFFLIAVASTAALLMSLDPAAFPRLARGLQSPLLIWLGRHSYGIYLVHGVLRPWVREASLLHLALADQRDVLITAYVSFVLGTSVSIVLALLLDVLWERHFLRLKDVLFHK